MQSKFVQKYGNAFDTAAIAEEHHIKVGAGKPGKSQITAQVQVLGKRELPREKKYGTVLFYHFISSDRSSYSDDGPLYIYLSAAPTFFRFSLSPLI